MSRRRPIEKKMSYHKALRESKRLCDNLGMSIDRKILSLVAALRMYGVRTKMSCQGHYNWGLPYPWVDIDSRDYYRASRLILAADPGKKLRLNIKGRQRITLESTWILENWGPRIRIAPRDIHVPLRTLQRRALRLAEKIKNR